MKTLDLLLVNAPSREAIYGDLARDLAAIEPPVWAGLIARHALDRGFTVGVLDAEAEGLSSDDTALRIAGRNPLLTAFCVYGQQPSASTQCLPGAITVAKTLRSLAPELPTVALGTHPSALPERTLREGSFDYVCQGEGPHTVTALLEALRGENRPQVPGLWHRDRSGKITSHALAENLTDLDRELPGQAWGLLDLTRYRAHNWHLWAGDQAGGYASVQTSLGCPFRCTFCCINAPFTAGGAPSGIRYWSPASVAAQIANLVNQHGITNVKIPDEMFCLNRQHVWQICQHLIDLKLGDKLNLWAYARVDTVKDHQMLAKMRVAGFRWLGIGVESGSKHVRDGVEKGRFDDDAIQQAINRVRGAGIAVAANYIFGLPDDTLESMQATLDLACELNTEWANFYCAMAYPGSVLHQTAVEKGWPLPEDPGGPGWIGYAQHAYEALPLPTYGLTSAQVLDFRDEAFLRYFSRGEYLEMLCGRFGERATEDVSRMLLHGKPKRQHRGEGR